MTTTGASYPLTTTFTAPSECVNFYVGYACTATTDCQADVFPAKVSVRDSQGDYTTEGCYPSSIVEEIGESQPQNTYLPGRICPLNMTTAASAVSPDGVWCCPTGLTWAENAPLCATTLTQGTLTVTTSAAGVFLEGQTLRFISTTATFTDTGSTANTHASTISESGPTSSGVSQQNSSGGSASQPVSLNVLIGAIVGSVLGFLALAGLGYYIFFLHKRAPREKLDDAPRDASGRRRIRENSRNGYEKPELDAGVDTTRSELEGHVVERGSIGAGINVRKPELQGTQGAGGAPGAVYVRRKAELEVPLQKASELEAIPWSTATREDRLLSPSPIARGSSRSVPGGRTSESELC
ncbi:hypothetical protein F5Y06DRAFT_302663 [Hypoxylon sp. FL0890]|nr:hypothetical protein F5Y06DRAFT_302663 [Hypoxylon sp. FL0890]